MDGPKINKTIKKKKRFYKPPPKPEMPKKYASVRFFEKRKILRKIEQLEKKIAAAKLMEASGADVEGESLEQLQENLEKWKKDEIYVKYYPKREKYISLFPKNNAEQAAEKREEMREKAEKIAARIEERNNKKKAKLERLAQKAEESESEEEADEDEGDDFFM